MPWRRGQCQVAPMRPAPGSFLWIGRIPNPYPDRLNMTVPDPAGQSERRYSNGELVRRLLSLAWQFRRDCLLSLLLGLTLLLLGLLGLQLLGVVIDVIRHALDATQRAPAYPFGWTPPESWTPLRIVTALSLAIVAQALLRAILTYQYNMVTDRLTQGKIVPDLRGRIY